MTTREQPEYLPHTALNKHVDINRCIIVEKSKRRDVQYRYDYLLFVYFLILPSLLHSSILFNCFLYLFLFLFIVLSVIYVIKWKLIGRCQNSQPHPSLTCVHMPIIVLFRRPMRLRLGRKPSSKFYCCCSSSLAPSYP